MKFICVIFASLLIAHGYAKGIPAIFEEEEAGLTVDECIAAVDCISDKLSETEFEREEDSTAVADMVQSIVGLVQGYFDCQNILSDPPSRAEELQHSICMTAWRARALITVVRIQQTLSNASDTVRSAWAVVQETCSEGRPILPCIEHLRENPDTEEVVPYKAH